MTILNSVHCTITSKCQLQNLCKQCTQEYKTLHTFLAIQQTMDSCNNTMKREHHQIFQWFLQINCYMLHGIGSMVFKEIQPCLHHIVQQMAAIAISIPLKCGDETLAMLPPQPSLLVGNSTYKLNNWHCSNASQAMTI